MSRQIFIIYYNVMTKILVFGSLRSLRSLRSLSSLLKSQGSLATNHLVDDMAH